MTDNLVDYDQIKCVFIIAQARSGSTLLMRLLNSIDGYNICGENAGALMELSRFYQSLKITISNSKIKDGRFLTYQELLAEPKYSEYYSGFEWYNIFNIEDIHKHLRKLVIYLFNPHNQHLIWGFKEVRYGLETNDYIEFKNQIDFIKCLFSSSKFIFNTRNLDDLVQSIIWSDDPESSRKILTKQKNFFLRYCLENPKFTYLIDYSDVVSNNKNLKKLYNFLGEDFNLENYYSVLQRR